MSVQILKLHTEQRQKNLQKKYFFFFLSLVQGVRNGATVAHRKWAKSLVLFFFKSLCLQAAFLNLTSSGKKSEMVNFPTSKGNFSFLPKELSSKEVEENSHYIFFFILLPFSPKDKYSHGEYATEGY